MAEPVTGPICDLAADGGDRFLAASTGPDNQGLTVWRDGHRMWTREAIHIVIWAIAIGTDGRVYTGGQRDRSLAIWDAATASMVERLDSPGKDVYTLIVSSDARRWVSCADCSCWNAVGRRR